MMTTLLALTTLSLSVLLVVVSRVGLVVLLPLLGEVAPQQRMGGMKHRGH